MNVKRVLPGVVLTLLIAGLAAAQNQPQTAMLGGANTVFDASPEAFTHPLPLYTEAELSRFEEGDLLFESEFDPQTMGPVLNAVSCAACHINDGRGRPPAFTGETGTGLATNEQTINYGNTPDPIYGGQFQDMAAGGTPAEGTISITYTEIAGQYADGTPYTLYAPQYELINLAYGPLDPSTTFSPRLANQMIGLGYFDAIDESTLVALSDPSDGNNDGISGRPNYVWDQINNQLSIGVFGWKANQPNMLQQTAAAFNGDVGITSSLNPEQPCTDNQAGCAGSTTHAEPPPPPPHNNGNRPPRNNHNDGEGRGGGGRGNRDGQQPVMAEISDDAVQDVAFYSGSLAVPAQRNANDPIVLRGQALFDAINCSGCHVPELQTGIHMSIPALSNQTIRPYTDLLLHDMGEGLADGQNDFQATGSEWRTPPLWGLGLFETVNGYAFYLHDGRARTIDEAILWHGGEGASSRDAFINMSAEDRSALLAFLRSL